MLDPKMKIMSMLSEESGFVCFKDTSTRTSPNYPKK